MLIEEFPWLKKLPPESRPEFEQDYVRASSLAAELGTRAPLDQTIREWKATADIYDDPVLVEALTGPIGGDFGPVPPPDGFGV
ncbi:hypothetical protein MOQ72_23570 [Saccharopolyspora sp. K220]|uniref:hypothetical protein n=1 Tax=Saccharopolyspora soli TaxID=2926618 RepID=UPI001F58298F|nr:hypothetical protein [Saccharopolyspora soli]MCI2420431.1 hypothetical protein [Saccharopolyspora soli]